MLSLQEKNNERLDDLTKGPQQDSLVVHPLVPLDVYMGRTGASLSASPGI